MNTHGSANGGGSSWNQTGGGQTEASNNVAPGGNASGGGHGDTMPGSWVDPSNWGDSNAAANTCGQVDDSTGGVAGATW